MKTANTTTQKEQRIAQLKKDIELYKYQKATFYNDWWLEASRNLRAAEAELAELTK